MLFFNDGRIATEPIFVDCGATGCKEYIMSSKSEDLDCYSCKGKHKTKKLQNAQVIKSTESIVKWLVNDLFKYAEEHLEKTFDLLKR